MSFPARLIVAIFVILVGLKVINLLRPDLVP